MASGKGRQFKSVVPDGSAMLKWVAPPMSPGTVQIGLSVL